MAIDPKTRYVGKINGATGDYPLGSARNITVPGDGTGTPLEQAWINDLWGFFQKLLDLAGITASGNPDTINASDYFDSMQKLFERAIVFDDSGSADAYELDSTRGSGANPKSYYDGQVVIFKAGSANTGASTVKIGSLALKDLTTNLGAALPSGLFVIDEYLLAVYNLADDRFEIAFLGGGGSSVDYGSLNYYVDIFNTPIVINIITQNILAIIPNSLILGLQKGMTFQNDREFLISKTGVYKVDWHMVLDSAIAPPDDDNMAGKITVNGVGVNSGASWDTYAIDTTAPTPWRASVSGSALLSLNSTDIVGLGVVNRQSVDDINVMSCSMVIKSV